MDPADHRVAPLRWLARRPLALQAGLIVAALLLIGSTTLTVVGLTGFQRYRPFTLAMEPTLHPGDRIWARPSGAPHRGDLVLLVPPRLRDAAGDPLLRYVPQATLVITRILAVGGDTIEGRDGHLVVDGKAADEPYLAAGTRTPDFDATTVPHGEVFFLGDHRENTLGSPHLGPASVSAVRAEVRWVGAPSMGPMVAVTLTQWLLWLYGIAQVLGLRRRLPGRFVDPHR